MIRNARVQMVAVLAAGLLLGYVAASGGFSRFTQPTADASIQPSKPAIDAKPPCCEGPNRGPLLARADGAPGNGGKKPNIVVIMGDDVGWFNIGAYHRGIMSG